MAKAISTLSIKVDLKDTGAQAVIDKIGSSISKLKVISGPTSQTIQKLRNEVTQLGQKGNNSISTIEGQIGALRGLRREADLNSKEFKELTADIEKYTQKLQKAQGQKKRGGLGARGATQVAGAVISGGIFGGPEGALGALGGAALGGVQGAFTGAAIGAQLKGLRQLMAGAGEYAAKIEKLKIALQGVTSSQGEFNFAVAAARQATEELNIPQAQSLSGVTRLAAAVKGAGGPLTDATLTFKNISAAIKATGGSTEDVKGAITAMVQVFSKGKVSAEELSGQLGERLPGAVTMFAKANKMTLPELQKNLKAGTVGLNELMRFIVELGSTYGGTAEKISDSNADAGARLQVQIQDLQAAVGEGLVPIGAQFQDAFARFIEEITPTLADVLPKIAQFFLDIAKNLGKVLEVAIVVLATVTVGKITAIMSSIGGLAGAMAKLSKAAGTARAALIGLNTTALVNPYTALAAGVTVLLIQLNKANRAQAQLNALISSGGVAQVDAEIAKLGGTKEYDLARDRMLQNEDKLTPYNIRGEGFGLPGQFSRAKDKKLVDTIDKLRARREVALYDARQGAALPDELLARFRLKSEEGYDDPTIEDKDKGGKGKTPKGPRDISDLQLQARLAAEVARRTDATNDEKRRALILERQTAVLASEELGANEQILAVFKAAEKFRNGMLKIETDITDQNKKQAEEARKLNEARMQLRDRLGLLSPQERVKAAQESFREQNPGATPEDLDLIRQSIDPTIFEQGIARIREMREELAQLVNPINVVANAGAAIGTAFTDSFRSVIDGSATTQEALASFFKNIANFFMDMAAQIIQKMITMAILNKVVGLLPGMSGGVGGGDIFSDIASRGGLRMADGGVFAKNKIIPYAKGGIVNRPTMFSYANGGAGQFGIMGEAGPEAILPLRRGPGGKLGVESSGGVGNVVVNVDASGSSVEGDNEQAGQLGKMLGAAVQAELIKQKRPGGLLA